MIDGHHGWNVSFKPIILGFIFSIVLNSAIYRILTHHHLSNKVLVAAIITFSCIQAILQLIFFLHVGLETKPHWNTIMLIFITCLIFILVGGSIWIMNHLGYNLMPEIDKMRNMW